MAIATFESVSAAAARVEATGAQASVRAVTFELGGGSPNVIGPILKSRKAGKPQGTVEITIDPKISKFIADQILSATTEANSKLVLELQTAEQDIETFVMAANESDSQIKLLKDALEAARDMYQEKSGRINQLESDIAEIRSLSEKRINDAEHKAANDNLSSVAAQVALAKADSRLEALPRLEKSLASALAELDLINKTCIEAQQSAAVATAKLAGAEARANAAESRESGESKRFIESEKSLMAKIQKLELDMVAANKVANDANINNARLSATLDALKKMGSEPPSETIEEWTLNA